MLVTPGDGIGPEVIAQGLRVLDHVAARTGHEIELIERPLGGCSIDAHGVPCTDSVLQDAKDADAILLGAVGGPKWNDPRSRHTPEEGVLRLRKELGLYANIRPVRVPDALVGISPIRAELVRGTDLVIFRELVGGLYFGSPKGPRQIDGEQGAVDTLSYTWTEIERLVRVGFEWARARRRNLVSVDKFNVLASGRLWREVAADVASEYPDVRFQSLLADAFAAALVQRPAEWDVIVTENTFGDFLSDEAGAFTGSLGMLPSASLGGEGPALYEPVHGSAPDITGQGIANPLGTILSVAMMFRHSFDSPTAAAAIEAAVDRTLADGIRTPDIYEDSARRVDSASMGAAVIARIEDSPGA